MSKLNIRKIPDNPGAQPLRPSSVSAVKVSTDTLPSENRTISSVGSAPGPTEVLRKLSLDEQKLLDTLSLVHSTPDPAFRNNLYIQVKEKHTMKKSTNTPHSYIWKFVAYAFSSISLAIVSGFVGWQLKSTSSPTTIISRTPGGAVNSSSVAAGVTYGDVYGTSFMADCSSNGDTSKLFYDDITGAKDSLGFAIALPSLRIGTEIPKDASVLYAKDATKGKSISIWYVDESFSIGGTEPISPTELIAEPQTSYMLFVSRDTDLGEPETRSIDLTFLGQNIKGRVNTSTEFQKGDADFVTPLSIYWEDGETHYVLTDNIGNGKGLTEQDLRDLIASMRL
jgi:hypothetical protein